MKLNVIFILLFAYCIYHNTNIRKTHPQNIFMNDPYQYTFASHVLCMQAHISLRFVYMYSYKTHNKHSSSIYSQKRFCNITVVLVVV